jgi:hypothetical protein
MRTDMETRPRVAVASGSEDAIAALLESAKSGGAKFDKVNKREEEEAGKEKMNDKQHTRQKLLEESVWN